MKKMLCLTIISCCVLAMPVVAAMKSSPAENNANRNNKSDLNRPIHATDIEISKKKVLSPDIIKGTKSGQKTSSGQDKEKKNPKNAASGILGDELAIGAEKYAVIIGVCDYPGDGSDLCWSDGDSLNMHQALVDSGYDEDKIYMYRDFDTPNTTNDPNSITRGSATASNIEVGISAIETVEIAGDEIVFFFSGHGASGIANDGDRERKDESIVVHNGTEAVFIWDGQLKERFKNFKTSRIIFIFDSCRAEGMNDVMEKGRIVVAGSEETKSGYVLSEGNEALGIFGEGVFTHYFVNEGMLQGLADLNDNDKDLNTKDVTVEEAFDYAKENILSVPFFWGQNPVINDLFDDDLLLGSYFQSISIVD